MKEFDNIAVFVFDANMFDKKEIDALQSFADYQPLYKENKGHIQYYETLSEYESSLNEFYMAADTFVKFVAKQ